MSVLTKEERPAVEWVYRQVEEAKKRGCHLACDCPACRLPSKAERSIAVQLAMASICRPSVILTSVI